MRRVKKGTRGSGPKNTASSRSLTSSGVSKPKTMGSRSKMVVEGAKKVGRAMTTDLPINRYIRDLKAEEKSKKASKNISAVEKSIRTTESGYDKLLRKGLERRKKIKGPYMDR